MKQVERVQEVLPVCGLMPAWCSGVEGDMTRDCCLLSTTAEVCMNLLNTQQMLTALIACLATMLQTRCLGHCC